ncbi:hypothetical protein HMPREF1084_01070 [Clostridium butyricum 60E.3]|uniref:Protein containing Zn-finger domain n=3 Tax=Clostridiaceae TaxID=31979 RepID=C4IGL8_CLOBU|nr:hypothetical protein [Clostridium butyricum]EDT74193.1 conserved protein containing Zn-finger domain [Clostridium butyricum 5521]EEP54614.1 conserved hypothetical protein [Clostridium butyricum E4 str. BoNT E BL5262]EMU54644.1 hypothetical protein CBDKU1_14580 [Clostridium butyricum DKU-01]ENZ36486.1 hypothetical protein HMPREF1084_01070 [Clostridium butyricum 60E.3]POO85436.1 hypothetical protein C1H59_16025 [Clostridium sp. 3-3]
MMGYKYTDDDYCDIYENKICDNCGKCLEMEGIDTKAIKIEDISKNLEENSVLEEEFINDLKSNLTDDELHEINEENLDLKDIYNRFGFNSSFDENSESEEYEDAFEHIEYIEELSQLNDADFEDMTEEVYPGVRRFKNTDK